MVLTGTNALDRKENGTPEDAEALGGLGRAADQADPDEQSGEGDGVEDEQGEGRDPGHDAGVSPEADRETHHQGHEGDDDHQCGVGDGPAREDREVGDGQGAKPVIESRRRLLRDGDGASAGGEQEPADDETGNKEVDVGQARYAYRAAEHKAEQQQEQEQHTLHHRDAKDLRAAGDLQGGAQGHG